MRKLIAAVCFLATGCTGAEANPLDLLASPTPTPVATPVPTLTPAPQVQTVATASPRLLTVKERVAAAWPGDDRRALRIVACETGRTWNPRIVSRSGKYRGLWQANADFWRSYGGHAYAPRADQATVEQQTAVAWRGFKARGWSPWRSCTR